MVVGDQGGLENIEPWCMDHSSQCPTLYSEAALNLEGPNSLNKEVRPFFLSGNSIWSFPSVSSLSDYSSCRS